MVKSKRAFFKPYGVDHRYGQVQGRRITRSDVFPEESIIEAETVSHFSPHSSHP
jgi:hypothetical protein